jgi:hypothetical protein
MRKKIAPIALGLALALGTQGCYGRFQLVRNLYKWNGSVGNKFVNEAVFLVLNIVPVYGFASFVDAVVLNTVEFWTGSNPVTAKVLTQGDKKVAMSFDKATGIVDVKSYDKGVLVSESFLKKDGDRVLAVDPSGKLLFAAGEDVNGTPSLADASGMILAQSTQQ